MRVSVRLGAILIPEYLDFLFQNIPNERALILLIRMLHVVNPLSPATKRNCK